MRGMLGPLRTFMAVLLAGALIVGALVAPTPARADPNPDGSPSSLQGQLDEASRAYNDAKGRLDTAKQRQADRTTQAAATKARVGSLTPQAHARARTTPQGC